MKQLLLATLLAATGVLASLPAYVFRGYLPTEPTVDRPKHYLPSDDATSGYQPVGTAAMGRGSMLGGAVLAMNATTASCMNFHRSTP
jgi:hypothetical protein